MAPSGGYKQQKSAIKTFAADVKKDVSGWQASGESFKAASIPTDSFSAHGHRFGQIHDQLIEDFAWYSWRIGQTLDRVGEALQTVADNYGKTEERLADDFRDIGESF